MYEWVHIVVSDGPCCNGNDGKIVANSFNFAAGDFIALNAFIAFKARASSFEVIILEQMLSHCQPVRCVIIPDPLGNLLLLSI